MFRNAQFDKKYNRNLSRRKKKRDQELLNFTD